RNGAWSYFLNWQNGGACGGNVSCAKGHPTACIDQVMEVGARNSAAPPWEGRLIPFGSPLASISDVGTVNDHIQKALLGVRPSGGTPINGMLADARDFLRNDGSQDMTTGAPMCDTKTGIGCFGPRFDPYVQGGCRKNFIILLTDGAPNLDLRPSCEAVGGV